MTEPFDQERPEVPSDARRQPDHYAALAVVAAAAVAAALLVVFANAQAWPLRFAAVVLAWSLGAAWRDHVWPAWRVFVRTFLEEPND